MLSFTVFISKIRYNLISGAQNFLRKCNTFDKLTREINPKYDHDASVTVKGVKRFRAISREPRFKTVIVSQSIRPNVFTNRIQSHFLRAHLFRYLFNMDYQPPKHVRGMKELDRSRFVKTVHVPTLEVPIKKVGEATRILRKSLFKVPGIKCVADLPDSDSKSKEFKKFLIDPIKHPDIDSFGDDVRASLKNLDIDLNSWKIAECDLKYENWTHDELLKAVLPEESDGVVGFTMIGHICHLNLRDEMNDYKKIIGQVIIDKIPAADTVVNKLNSIDNTFRNFRMEVLAGEDNFITIAKENGFQYKMDFSKVYWNSRLATEHNRIVTLLQKGDVVYDMCAGIGPFSVPAAKKGCEVFANDLNPESYKWLVENFKLNKVKKEPRTSNLDGRQFVKEIVKLDLLKRFQSSGEEPKQSIRIIMNLPALAIEFLDVFRGLYSDVDSTKQINFKAPIVHCYCFSKSEDPVSDAKQRVEEVLCAHLPVEGTIRHVRNVAPNKEMMCVSFPLQKEVLFTTKIDQDVEEPEVKRFKQDD